MARQGKRALLLRLEAVWRRSADSRAIAYTLFAILYSVPNLVLAHRKLMWTDEFFTLYLSKTNWNELWRALSTGGDQHPPSFYYLTHLIFNLAGTTHLTLRLAPLIGFGLFCICLCEIARRVVGRRWALVALLLPLTTPDLDYATEGRGYGIELGFVTFSLLMWILAAEGKKRTWTVPALAAGLCLSVASHYYAVLLLIPLIAGELVKTRLRRSIDVPVYISFLAALIPLVLFAPIIVQARTYSANFWAKPSWGQMVMWYPQSTGYMILLFFAASGLSFVLRIPASQYSRKAASPQGPRGCNDRRNCSASRLGNGRRQVRHERFPRPVLCCCSAGHMYCRAVGIAAHNAQCYGWRPSYLDSLRPFVCSGMEELIHGSGRHPAETQIGRRAASPLRK